MPIFKYVSFFRFCVCLAASKDEKLCNYVTRFMFASQTRMFRILFCVDFFIGTIKLLNSSFTFVLCFHFSSVHSFILPIFHTLFTFLYSRRYTLCFSLKMFFSTLMTQLNHFVIKSMPFSAVWKFQ